MTLVLGIESSCDETAAAVVSGDGRVRSDVVRSQIELHAPFGGVVPELAARDHLRVIVPVVSEALSRAGVALADVDAIAVTQRPGLVGALLVGVQAAKGLAWAAEKPLIAVDHLVGHLLSVFLRRDGDPAPEEVGLGFPFIGLLVSGGHSAIYRCDGPAAAQIRELGATRDDAVGEAFDKIAKLLGLGYPGGPVIDRLAPTGIAERATVSLGVPMAANKSSLEFSFSGLKSAIARHVLGASGPHTDAEIADICAAFQKIATKTLVTKTILAASMENVSRVVITGGVACNRELRERMGVSCRERGYDLFVPPFKSCTDNAAMIAYAGTVKLAAGDVSGFDLAPVTRTELARVTRKGRGIR
ncbi:MAG: tRNA (adenosine(37)-N6)-threonylcarbamoyltransferase complex transferase subunit TsaD [Myxococcales bacterium]|nr:tRNA (adenosine(37)-N6)-threonylcarbamoyltransferase complex transferase subunit TsaD [Myxococcales bacterium]